MRSWSAVLPVLALTLLACEKSPRDKLQGKWVGESVANVHPSQRASAEGWAKGMSVEFKGRSVTVGLPAEPARNGTFTVSKIEGSELEVLFHRTTGEKDFARVRFEQDGRMTWKLAGADVVLARSAP
jgi:hypothetical protein